MYTYTHMHTFVLKKNLQCTTNIHYLCVGELHALVEFGSTVKCVCLKSGSYALCRASPQTELRTKHGQSWTAMWWRRKTSVPTTVQYVLALAMWDDGERLRVKGKSTFAPLIQTSHFAKHCPNPTA